MDNKQEYKTADYTRRANNNYRNKKDNINILLEKGTKERIFNKYGKIAISKYIQELIEKDLKEKEDIKTVDNFPFTRPTE